MINQNNNTSTYKDNTASRTNINPSYNTNNDTSLNIIPTKNTDLLEKFGSGLNDEQKKAYLLFCDHHQRNNQICENNLSQLLLYLSGAGRTGKSRVIQAICFYFEHILQHDSLIVLAPTGNAAVNICGSTIHSACGFGFNKYQNNNSISLDEHLCQLQEYWSKIKYAIIDEISMIRQKLLMQFHTFTKRIKMTNDSTPFTEINILFARDFMQLLPVLDVALYMLNKINHFFSSPNLQTIKGVKRKHDIDPLLFGLQTVVNTTDRSLWLNVKYVIQLKFPMRQIDDPFYASILENMCCENLTETQISALRSKVLGDNKINSPE
ncbi:142_t:CDS:1 [Cetraspora pellucida]|uniref:ATP-dependent DNA helicase n=1 Tax=Cetraspora pellucida TaxID=1433469 RepID=A0A9N9IDU0_9GLOM|nr:142_t:CDS:1 [Cetraspora pellucida]